MANKELRYPKIYNKNGIFERKRIIWGYLSMEFRSLCGRVVKLVAVQTWGLGFNHRLLCLSGQT